MAGALAMLMGAARIVAPCSISGDLGAAGSTTTVTGAVQTVTVPAGNPGVLQFSGLSFSSVGDIQVNRAGGGWDTLYEGYENTWTDGQSIQMRCVLEDAFNWGQVGIYDQATGVPLQAAIFERTS
ncbi:MAG: hypothetical protein BroJett013_30630 [Alphaproteobacteria bacterium]|nr:MAG: hypothetical protein BroJett013_30630 [Alphaproteobacteria bacterium]